MTSRWLEGVYLGTRFQSNEHLVALDDGRVVKARSVQALPECPSIARGDPVEQREGAGGAREAVEADADGDERSQRGPRAIEEA